MHMMEQYPVFTAQELMVLLSVSGGSSLRGFFPERVPRRQEILAATAALMRRGLLTSGPDGAFEPVPGTAAEMIRPMCDPELVVYVTPMAEEEPQVAFAFGKDGAVGYESVLVQEGAVRLFPMHEDGWLDQLRNRGLLPEEEIPEARRKVAAESVDFDTAPEQLEQMWNRGVAYLEFHRRGGIERKVYLRDGAGDVQAVVMTPTGSLSTNDSALAVRLRDWQMEETTK